MQACDSRLPLPPVLHMASNNQAGTRTRSIRRGQQKRLQPDALAVATTKETTRDMNRCIRRV